jgi:hypothetical protein
MADFTPEELGPASDIPGGSESQQTLDIIRKSLIEEEGTDKNIEGRLKQLAIALKANELFLLRIGNTVFLLRPSGGKSVEFHVATIEDPKVLMDRMTTGAKTLKGFGYEHVTSYSSNPAFVRMAKQMSASDSFIHPTVKQLPPRPEYKFPVYQFDADL